MDRFDTMDCIIYAAVLCHGIYLAVQNVRLFLANEKVRKEYLNKCKDGYTMVNRYLPYMIFSLGFFVISIAGIFVMEKNTKDELCVYSALALVVITSAGMALDSIVKRRTVVDDDGFVHEKTYYRFHSIPSMNPMKSTIENIDILTMECQHMVVPKKMGVYLHECFLAWKKHKKNKNK